jgi:hypothetical protein
VECARDAVLPTAAHGTHCVGFLAGTGSLWMNVCARVICVRRHHCRACRRRVCARRHRPARRCTRRAAAAAACRRRRALPMRPCHPARRRRCRRQHRAALCAAARTRKRTRLRTRTRTRRRQRHRWWETGWSRLHCRQCCDQYAYVCVHSVCCCDGEASTGHGADHRQIQAIAIDFIQHVQFGYVVRRLGGCLSNYCWQVVCMWSMRQRCHTGCVCAMCRYDSDAVRMHVQDDQGIGVG